MLLTKLNTINCEEIMTQAYLNNHKGVSVRIMLKVHKYRFHTLLQKPPLTNLFSKADFKKVL